MAKTKFLLISACLLFLVPFTSCSSYRVVKLGPGVDENNIVTPFYAVAQNNVVVPEYVVDRYGNYPTSPEEAQKRFDERKASVEPLAKEKYLFPTGASKAPNFLVGVGLALVSPIVVPIEWLGEAFSGKKEKKSFSQVASNYFDASFNSAYFEKPQIRERVDYFY